MAENQNESENVQFVKPYKETRYDILLLTIAYS